MSDNLWGTVQYNALNFTEFWQHYPRKIKKLAAEKAYRLALHRAPHHVIMAGLMVYPFSPERQFQPHAASWLNAGGWIIEEDTPPPTVIVNGGHKPTSVTTLRTMGSLLDDQRRGVEQSDDGDDP